MKKGKIFTKGQIAITVMFLALGAAVWLNVKYSGNDKFLGQATYVKNSGNTSSAVETSAKAKEKTEDYFETAKKERDESFEKLREQAEETLKSAALTDADKKSAIDLVNKLSNRIATAQNIESLLKAKNFKNAVAVINDDNINIVVSGDKLTETQTVQIQDIVLGQTNTELSKIKIITVK